MNVITEVHTIQEMARAKELESSIIGINNRNLKTLTIDLNTTNTLLPLASKNALLISESGFSKRSELKLLSGKVRGFLIGSSLMQAERIDLAMRELLFGRVKICGLTNREDALYAYASGAYYGGLNFSSRSKRRVSLSEAQAIKKDVPLVWGGIFVNQPQDEVVEIAKILNLDFVQVHGDETEAYMEALKLRLINTCEVWRSLRITHQLSTSLPKVADRILLDNYDSKEFGGTGQAFDWSMLENVTERHQYVIAGGINPANVVTASELLPFALDIASGVEEGNPRKKSLEKIHELFLRLWP
jgi:indole-3-glycerol phosphate synthase / phosphoribosylanthranilate isomerase